MVCGSTVRSTPHVSMWQRSPSHWKRAPPRVVLCWLYRSPYGALFPMGCCPSRGKKGVYDHLILARLIFVFRPLCHRASGIASGSPSPQAEISKMSGGRPDGRTRGRVCLKLRRQAGCTSHHEFILPARHSRERRKKERVCCGIWFLTSKSPCKLRRRVPHSSIGASPWIDIV